MIIVVFSTINLALNGYVCVTFRSQGDHEQTILTNYDSANPTLFNEISTTNTKIYIQGQKYARSTYNIIIIQHTTIHTTI